MWEIELYKTKDGKEVVADFLDTLPDKHRAKALWEIDLLANHGINLKMPYVEHIEDELWELRIKFASDISRVFYFTPSKEKFVLLHGFVKKTNKVPPGEIDTARKRMLDYKERSI
jgi:phage-related protein